MYVVEWNMNIDILTAIYLYLFKNVIQVRNLTCTPCFYQVKIFSKKCTCVYLIQELTLVVMKGKIPIFNGGARLKKCYDNVFPNL